MFGKTILKTSKIYMSKQKQSSPLELEENVRYYHEHSVKIIYPYFDNVLLVYLLF